MGTWNVFSGVCVGEGVGRVGREYMQEYVRTNVGESGEGIHAGICQDKRYRPYVK